MEKGSACWVCIVESSCVDVVTSVQHNQSTARIFFLAIEAFQSMRMNVLENHMRGLFVFFVMVLFGIFGILFIDT